MNIKAVLNKQGKIVSAIYRSEKPVSEENGKPAPRMGPVLGQDQTVVELGMPDEFVHYPVEHFIEKLTAEVHAKLHTGTTKK